MYCYPLNQLLSFRRQFLMQLERNVTIDGLSLSTIVVEVVTALTVPACFVCISALNQLR